MQDRIVIFVRGVHSGSEATGWQMTVEVLDLTENERIIGHISENYIIRMSELGHMVINLC